MIKTFSVFFESEYKASYAKIKIDLKKPFFHLSHLSLKLSSLNFDKKKNSKREKNLLWTNSKLTKFWYIIIINLLHNYLTKICVKAKTTEIGYDKCFSNYYCSSQWKVNFCEENGKQKR